MNLHIIYTETNMYLSKKQYSSWRDIQSEFPDFKTSLGPWTKEETVDFLQDEYSRLEPDATTQVMELVNSAAAQREVTFRG